jgi:PAS domain S-box-containing protein
MTAKKLNKCICKKNEFEQSLRETKERYQKLIEISADAFIVIQNGAIKECNPPMTALSGYGLEELTDTCFASFFHTQDIPAVESLGKDTLEDPDNVANLQARLVCKNGHQINVAITAGGCTFQQKTAALCVLRDISHQLDAEAAANKDRTLDSIAALSGGIAHDYNNLLTAIIGNISLAQAYLDHSDKPFRLLDHALVASKTAKNLTQKLITFSKGGSPSKVVTAVDRLVKNAVEFTLSGSNIKSDYSFAPNLWPIDVDQSQIGQAIHNVVMNAREAMPQGGHIKIAATNAAVTDEIVPLSEGNFVKISVTDQGCGIQPEEFGKIFEPYYSTKDMGHQKGTGLGLSISHSIIKRHGGEVSLTSQVGVGTTFNIYLPAAQTRPKIKKKVVEPDRSKRIFGEGKILVMDDDQMILELAGGILQHLGYRVEFAHEGSEAIAAYQAALKSDAPFDAVIMDLTVRGGMGGKEAMQKLKAIDAKIKGIVSSGYSEDPVMTGYEEHGFMGVVAKPYTVEELGAKLSQVLNG